MTGDAIAILDRQHSAAGLRLAAPDRGGVASNSVTNS